MRLRPDIIKLDRSLIATCPHDPAKVALAESLVRFAQRTGAAVCGEGIEELDELVVLADLDMTYGQGYALARPGPAWPQADEAMLESCAPQRAQRPRPDGRHRLDRGRLTGAWSTSAPHLGVHDRRGAVLRARDRGGRAGRAGRLRVPVGPPVAR